MTKQSKATAIGVALLALALIVGIAAVMKMMSGPAKRTVTVDAGATTRRTDPLIASAVLGQIDLTRQAVLEADISDTVRSSVVARIDEGHAKMRAILDDDTLTSATRDARLKEVQTNFTPSLNETRDVRLIVAERARSIWFELDLLSRRRLLPLMFEKLDLTDAQHKAADAAFMEVSVVLRNEPAGGLPNERSMQAMLTGRDKLHALLTPEQREQFKTILNDERQARMQAMPHRLTISTRPATAATPSATSAPATQQ